MSHSFRSHAPIVHAETVSGFPRPNTFSEPTFEEPFNAASVSPIDSAWSLSDTEMPSPDARFESSGHGDFLLG